ncbi:uncharacterized protein V1513DRAFT_410785 [Lipomyces chichibuensis]|uniref:uncharacterized protein n=1 Tax=Lipomyces chichibuensis TaxID=1546026 RepID=UPI003343D760
MAYPPPSRPTQRQLPSDDYLYDTAPGSAGPYPDSRPVQLPRRYPQQPPYPPGPQRGPPPPPSQNYNYPQQYYGAPGPYRRGPPRAPQAAPHGDNLAGGVPPRRFPAPNNPLRQRQRERDRADDFDDDGEGGNSDDVVVDDYSSMISDDLGAYDSRFPRGAGGALSQLKMQQQRPLRRPGGVPQRPPPQQYQQQYRDDMEYMNGGMQRMDINGSGRPPPARRGPPMRQPLQAQYQEDDYYYGNGQGYVPAPLPPPHARGRGMPRSASGPVTVQPPPQLPLLERRRGSDSPMYTAAPVRSSEYSQAYEDVQYSAESSPSDQVPQPQPRQEMPTTMDISPTPPPSQAAVPANAQQDGTETETVDEVLDMYMDDTPAKNDDAPDRSPPNKSPQTAPDLSEEEPVRPSNSSNSSSESSEPRTASPYLPAQSTRQARPTQPMQYVDDQEYYPPQPPMTMVPPLLRKPMLSPHTFAPRPASPHLYGPPLQQGHPRQRGPFAPVRGPPPPDNQQMPPQPRIPGQGYRGVQQPPRPVPGGLGPRGSSRDQRFEPEGAYASSAPRAATFESETSSLPQNPGFARMATNESDDNAPYVNRYARQQPVQQQQDFPGIQPSRSPVQSAAAAQQNKQAQPANSGHATSTSHPAPVRQYSPASAMSAAQAILPPDPITVSTPLTQSAFDAATQRARDQKHNAEIQLAYAKALLEAASSPALSSMSGKLDPKATRKCIEKWTLSAQKIIKKLSTASKPYPEAVYYLGTCYGAGGKLGLEMNREKEFEHYKKASKLGHVRGSYRTAVCFELGSGTRKDEGKAWNFYKQAAQQGDTASMYKIGMVLLRGGLGQGQSTSESLIWLKRAADHADPENPHALYELGRLYETADGSNGFLPHDDNLALELYGKAATLGYIPAQYKMGAAHEYGHMGCSIDPQRSIAWYSRAAQKGDAESELGLSGWYLTGADNVLPKSETESYLWARRASEKGLAKAEYAVGYFMENGIGTTVNMHEAIRWYNKAAAQKYPKALNRLRELTTS